MRERTPFPRALLERLPKLKLLVTTGHRNDSIDLAAAKERGIAVYGTPSSGHAAAELTWALIMAAARRIDLETQSFRDGGWQVDRKSTRLNSSQYCADRMPASA